MLVQHALSAENVPLNPAQIAEKVPFASVVILLIALKVPLKPAAKIDHVCWNSELMLVQHALSAENVPLNPALDC